MKFLPSEIDGAWLIEPERHVDSRGSFARELCARELAAQGLNGQIVQVNVSINDERGTLRGMHYQRDPHGETKVVRVLRGSIFDVLVDLRLGSPTHRRWWGVELSADAGRALYIPIGVAHGFQTLEPGTIVQYFMGSFHEPTAAAGIAHDDPALGIRWPLPVTAISDADRHRPRLGP